MKINAKRTKVTRLFDHETDEESLSALLDGWECARCPGGGRRWGRETDGSYGGTLQDCGCREVR